MKKKLVLMVLLFLVNSFTLLAQNNKADSAALKKDAEKNTISAPATDTTAAKKAKATDKKATEKSRKNKKDITSISAGGTKPTVADSSQRLSKTNLNTPLPTDSLPSKKSKTKPPKPKSARQLKKEAKKNDINNLSETAIAKIAFQHMEVDSAGTNAIAAKHIDISYTNARTFALTEPTSTTSLKFYHRYWRDIDVKDPKNKVFAKYHSDLITALLTAIRKKEINAYSANAVLPDNPTGDAFTMILPYDQMMSGLSDTGVVNILDKDGNITGTKSVPNPFTPDKISGYRIKEDVFYDKTRAKFITRIIGIAPLVQITLSNGEVVSIQPLCWLKYKDCRKIMITLDVDPSRKIGDTMDDIFLQRRFYSKIVAESNPKNERIKDYKPEVPDQEIEALRIEKKIALYKTSVWNYIMLTKAPEGEVKAENKPAPKAKKVKVSTAVAPK